MAGSRINLISGRGLLVLSLVALFTVMIGYINPPQPNEDEGTLAHIFQLTIVAFGATGLVYLASADWRQPLKSMRALIAPAVALVLAFGALYKLEHYR